MKGKRRSRERSSNLTGRKFWTEIWGNVFVEKDEWDNKASLRTWKSTWNFQKRCVSNVWSKAKW